jgi:hypothetical protein
MISRALDAASRGLANPRCKRPQHIQRSELRIVRCYEIPSRAINVRMSDATSRRKLATLPKAGREPRISKKLHQAIDALAKSGGTQADAAKSAGLSPEHFSRMLARPHVRGILQTRAREILARGQVRASARLLELIDSASSNASLNASELVLRINGIAPPAQPNPLVNLNISPGYVVDLSGGRVERPAAPTVIDHTGDDGNGNG